MAQGFEIDIQSNLDYVAKHLTKDLRSVIEPSRISAISRALTSSRTETYRRLSKTMGITRKNLSAANTVTIKRPGKANTSSWLKVKGRPTSGAGSLKARPATRETSGRGHLKSGGVSFSAWGKRQKAKKAFIMPATGGLNQPSTSGPQKYFVALRLKSGKIIGIYGPWAPREYSSRRGKKQGPGVDFYMTIKFNQVFKDRYVHEVNRRLTRILKGSGYMKLKGVKNFVSAIPTSVEAKTLQTILNS